jgi:methylglutaconyl-CoA hydratase
MRNVSTIIRPDGRATITLSRPEVHNAFDDALIAELTASFEHAAASASVRAVVLESEGPSFSAGADLGWMRRMAGYSDADNRRDALALARLMHVIDRCPKPVVAVVQGAAFGGGVGLVAACDMAIAAESAVFCLSEVRLGLVPAVISPYVAGAIGERACRRYFLTAERFSAAEAHRLGLVHVVAAAGELHDVRDHLLRALGEGGPQAQAAAKELVRAVTHPAPGTDLLTWTAARIAEVRASDEAREGLSAFLEKRSPAWRSAGEG